MIVRSKAPLRISFAGGGTDVPPYPQEHGGAVLSTTINKYAYASLVSMDDDSSTFMQSFGNYSDLVKATVKRMLLQDRGLKIFLQNDAPLGSGLGSSSAMVVALIELFKNWLHSSMTDYEHADLAYQIERIDLGIKGGMQDQYAATFGGFNLIEFTGDTVVVNPLRVDSDHINELEHNLLLCYTGSTHFSGHILERQIDSYMQKNEKIISALGELKWLAYTMTNVLLRGKIDDFGNLLHQEWLNKQQLDSQISTPRISELYETARIFGALGGKITGAGGGGHLLLYCPFEKKHIIAEHLEKQGGQIVPFGFESKGVQTWRVIQSV